MDALLAILKPIGLIVAVIAFFNVTIFIHELGHFWAARWRGLHVDRFQVWFGKPIWKKTYNGVSYGLGSIPAGGFVSLPQMAPMQSVEGKADVKRDLPPISPLDKIIVAAAGPLFSFLLALAFALIVWSIGKPTDLLETTQIGFVDKDSPAEKAGLKAGDTILEVEGEPVETWTGSYGSITERILFSEGETISFLVKREGETEPVLIESGYRIPETKMWERRGLRQVGIAFASPSIIESTLSSSPAERAGLKPNDEIVTWNGKELYSPLQLSAAIENNPKMPLDLGVKRGSKVFPFTVTPRAPITPKDKDPMLGVAWAPHELFNTQFTYPTPVKQLKTKVHQMWITITKVISPKSSIGVQHLSGPVGIAKIKYQLLDTDEGLRRLLSFMVFFNVNLAILNLLPFPVLDGGHILMAIMEKIKGRPSQGRVLEYIQTSFALLLISFMLFVTFKDLGSFVPGAESRGQDVEVSFE